MDKDKDGYRYICDVVKPNRYIVQWDMINPHRQRIIYIIRRYKKRRRLLYRVIYNSVVPYNNHEITKSGYFLTGLLYDNQKWAWKYITDDEIMVELL